MNQENVVPNAVNVIGWLLVAASAVVLVTAVVGLILFAISPGAHMTWEKMRIAREAFYVLHFSRHSPWLMILCILLSLVIGWIGYTCTDRYIAARMPTIPKESKP
jgi:hypothetical protein